MKKMKNLAHKVRKATKGTSRPVAADVSRRSRRARSNERRNDESAWSGRIRRLTAAATAQRAPTLPFVEMRPELRKRIRKSLIFTIFSHIFSGDVREGWLAQLTAG